MIGALLQNRYRIDAELGTGGMGTAAAASYRSAGRDMNTEPPFRFVTASLHVDYVRPTPLSVPLEIRARVIEMKGRKVVMEATLSAEGQVCAQGEVVAVQMPEYLANPNSG